jgi:hypothetical protein
VSKQTLKYEDDNYKVELTVRQATVRDGMYRGILLGRVNTEVPKDENASRDDRVFRAGTITYYCACLSVTDIDSQGKKKLTKDISLDDFLDLPDAMVDPWNWSPFATVQPGDEQGEAGEPNDEKA